MSKNVSIKDLAKLANVSHSTVSRALRGSPLIGAETTALIQRLAAEHKYRASLVARSLVSRQTKTIGCVVTSIADPFFAEVIEGVGETARKCGYSVILASSGLDPEREIATVLSLHENRVDGVLVASSRLGSKYGSSLAEMEIPIVLVNNQHRGAYTYSVNIDDLAASRQIAAYLIQSGHRRIACIGDNTGTFSDELRTQGWRDAIVAAAFSVPNEWIVKGDGTPEGGFVAMSQLLSRRRLPTAVLCYNDLTALGALSAIHTAGLRVPDDISITGFDDVFIARYTHPPLTTIRQPMRQMGIRATEILLDLLSGKRAKRIETMAGELIVRGSVSRI